MVYPDLIFDRYCPTRRCKEHFARRGIDGGYNRKRTSPQVNFVKYFRQFFFEIEVLVASFLTSRAFAHAERYLQVKSRRVVICGVSWPQCGACVCSRWPRTGVSANASGWIGFCLIKAKKKSWKMFWTETLTPSDYLLLCIFAFSSWVKLNPGLKGFYRVRYSGDLLNSLIDAVKDQSMPARDRLGLQSDLFALVSKTCELWLACAAHVRSIAQLSRRYNFHLYNLLSWTGGWLFIETQRTCA